VYLYYKYQPPALVLVNLSKLANIELDATVAYMD
jgi:hypothetical protein